MKAVFITLPFILFFTLHSFSQEIRENSVSFMDEKQNAVEAKYNFSEDIMETVVNRVLQMKNIKKSKSTKGYNAYQHIVFNELSSEIIDLYIKVEGNSVSSVITILISKGYNNFIASSSDASTIKNAKTLCKVFNVNAIEEQLNREIAKQEKVIKEVMKRYNRLQKKGIALMKDKENIIKKIGENIEEQQTIKTELEEQKNILDTLNSRK